MRGNEGIFVSTSFRGGWLCFFGVCAFGRPGLLGRSRDCTVGASLDRGWGRGDQRPSRLLLFGDSVGDLSGPGLLDLVRNLAVLGRFLLK